MVPSKEEGEEEKKKGEGKERRKRGKEGEERRREKRRNNYLLKVNHSIDFSIFKVV